MRKIAVIVLAAALTAPSALAQTAFVPVETLSDEVTFVDVGEIKRNGEELELRLLEFQTRNAADPIAYTATLSTVRYSCDWNTSVLLDYVIYKPDGSIIPSDTLRRGGTPFFFGAGAWHAAAGPVICDAAAPPPSKSFTSMKAAIAEGVRITKRRPAPKPGATMTYDYVPPGPSTLPNFAELSTSHFGLVTRDPVSGNSQYLDWGNLVRKGAIVHAITVDALGVTQPGPKLLGRLKLSSVEIDCEAGAVTVLAYVDFDDFLQQGYLQNKVWPTRTARNWALGGLLTETACDGKEPEQTLRSLDDVLQAQRQKPGTSPPPPG